MSSGILSQRWNGFKARYRLNQPIQENLELPTKSVPEIRNVQHHLHMAGADTSSAYLENSRVHPTRDGEASASSGSVKKARLSTPQRWRKSLRFLRLVTWPLAFLKHIFFGSYYLQNADVSSQYFTSISLEILFESLFMAWDIWRIFQSLYERSPGYDLEIIFFIEIIIMVACILAVPRDMILFMVVSIPAYYALWELPAILVSLFIVRRHFGRYKKRRRERIQYATVKPQLAFTPSGEPVAIYLPQEIYGPSSIGMLSMDSLQEGSDAQANDSEYHSYEAHNSSRHDNESQVSLLGERATTSFAIHDEIGTAVHRPTQPALWSGECSR